MFSQRTVLLYRGKTIISQNSYGGALRQITDGILKSIRRNYNKYKIEDNIPKVAIKIRTIKEEDIPQVMELRRQVKVHDVPTSLLTWMKIDPEGIKVALNENGMIVGSISMVQNFPGVYQGGLYCVHEKYRNLRIGSRLCVVILPRLKGTNAFGNSVLEMLHKYVKAGHLPFIDENFTSLKNYIPNPENPMVLSNKELPDNIEIEPYQECLLPSIVQYDASVAGFEREQMLALSCQERDSQTFAAFRNGTCIGYGSIKRSCLDAGRVGPLFADDPVVAEALLKKLLESYPNRKGFAMMTLKKNDYANSFIRKLGNAEIDTCIRIYRTEKLKLDTDRIFALFDMNFSVT